MVESVGQKHIVFTIVIPAYNEVLRLPKSLASISSYLAAKPYLSEVIVVDDGSTDGTAELVKTLAAQWQALRLIQGPHLGKGGAVRAGLLGARGEYVAIADADLSMPIAEFDRFAPEVIGSYDVAIGSREAPGAVRYGEPQYRHVMGRVFNAFVRRVLLPSIQDTQCGFKCLRRPIAVDLCSCQTITGWGFDVEMLYIASQRGYRIREVPIPWHYVPGSRISPVRDTFTMIRDVLAIRSRARRGRYAAQSAESGEMSDAAAMPSTLPSSRQ